MNVMNAFNNLLNALTTEPVYDEHLVNNVGPGETSQWAAEQAELNDKKRQAALTVLGENWILHPRYIQLPRHALKGWEPHSVLQPVMHTARIQGRI